MRKILSFAIVAAVVAYFAACSVEMDYNPNHEKPILKNPYVVSIPQAIDRLNAMFPNSVTATRARVSEVTTLSRKDFGLITRANTTEDAPLIYIIPTDNEGCAIMGADSRMTPLYAVLESTTLTAEDFLSMNTRTDSGDSQEEDSEIREFVAGLLYDAATDDYLELPSIPWDSTRPEPDIELLPVIKYIDSLTESHQVYLATKWNQSSEQFVRKLPASFKVAGCVTIAIAQIAYHNRMPQAIGMTTFDWDKISAYEYKNRDKLLEIGKDENIDATALFIASIANAVNAEPNGDQTSSNFVDAYNFFVANYSGYNVVPMMYTEEIMKSMIIKNNPIFIRGENNTSKIGHAWVIDGYRKYEEFEHNLNSGEIYKVDSLHKNEYFHCNFGWSGKCDGYYYSKVFNVSDPVPYEYRIDSIGDIGFLENIVFNDNFRIIYYDKVTSL